MLKFRKCAVHLFFIWCRAAFINSQLKVSGCSKKAGSLFNPEQTIVLILSEQITEFPRQCVCVCVWSSYQDVAHVMLMFFCGGNLKCVLH